MFSHHSDSERYTVYRYIVPFSFKIIGDYLLYLYMILYEKGSINLMTNLLGMCLYYKNLQNDKLCTM